jgi:hypothetical protein
VGSYFGLNMDEFPDEDEMNDFMQQTTQATQVGQSGGRQQVEVDDEDEDDLAALEHLHDTEDKENKFKRSLFQRPEVRRIPFNNA